MRSRLQQQRRRQSRRRQTIRRGGRIEYKLWQVSYEVLCNEDPNVLFALSAYDLFNMANTGLYEMATGHGDYPISGAENVVVSQLFNREREAYRIQLDVMFGEHMDPSDMNEWKAAYFAGIRGEELFANGSFVPTENTFFAEPIDEPEYPEWQPPREVRDV